MNSSHHSPFPTRLHQPQGNQQRAADSPHCLCLGVQKLRSGNSELITKLGLGTSRLTPETFCRRLLQKPHCPTCRNRVRCCARDRVTPCGERKEIPTLKPQPVLPRALQIVRATQAERRLGFAHPCLQGPRGRGSPRGDTSGKGTVVSYLEESSDLPGISAPIIKTKTKNTYKERYLKEVFTLSGNLKRSRPRAPFFFFF